MLACFSIQKAAGLVCSIVLLSQLRAGEPPRAAPAFPERILPAGTAQVDLRAYLMSRVRPFRLPSDAVEWERQSGELRSRMLSEVIFRGVPSSWREIPTRAEWQAVLPGEGYRIRKLRYEVVPGLWVGALLYEPLGLRGNVPAILNLNGHAPTGLCTDYVQALSINLARRGMLVLALEWVGMGQLKAPGYQHNNQAYLDLCGVSGVSVMYLELQRALDVLCGHPHTDLERVAVTGLSGGAWQTIIISALEMRVRLAAPNAGFTGIATRIQSPPDMGDYEQAPPDLSAVADYQYLVAMLAPRPALLIFNDKDDCCFRADRSKGSVYDPIVPVYELFGNTGRFALHINSDPGTHNYLDDNREAFYRFLHRHFAPGATWPRREIPVKREIRGRPELNIEYPADNADFRTLAQRLMQDLPKKSADPSMLRSELRGLLRLTGVPLPVRAQHAGPATRPVDLQAMQETLTLRLGDRWNLPLLVLVPPDPKGPVDIVLADGGRGKLRPSFFEPAMRSGRHVMLVDLLFLGECDRLDIHRYLWSNLLNTVGDRPLGVQVEQLASVVEWTRGRFSGPVRLRTHGRMASLAALTLAALEPQQVESIETHGLELSLKGLLAAGVVYEDAPSVFCPGLLDRLDIADLVRLASPTRVQLLR